MTVKATLRIVLTANDIVVAESENSALWQQTLASITGVLSPGIPPAPTEDPALPKKPSVALKRPARPTPTSLFEPENDMTWPAEAIEAFARELRLDAVTVQGACDPTPTPPYLHLDVHTWEDFKKNTGLRGKDAVPQIGLAATLLLLWFRQSQSGAAMVTVNQAQSVLKTIALRDKNAGRGLKNCDWLQARDDDTIRLNPSKFSAALDLARAFCARKRIEDLEPAERG